jgi:hypothetical protein
LFGSRSLCGIRSRRVNRLKCAMRPSCVTLLP